MDTKLMKMNHELKGPFAWRGGLEVVDGAVVRFVWEGANHTYYVYGLAHGEPFVEDGERVVRVADVMDDGERERIRLTVAAVKETEPSDVVWAKF